MISIFCLFYFFTDGTVTSTADLRAETTVSYSIQFYVNDSQISIGPAALTVLLSGTSTCIILSSNNISALAKRPVNKQQLRYTCTVEPV